MRVKYIIISILFAITSTANAVNKNLEQKIKEIIHKKTPNAHVGVLIHDLNSHENIVEFNSTKLYTPASTTKLFTAVAGYLVLGPEFRFNTSVYVNANKNKSSTKHLYFKFSGDPELTKTKLYSLVKKLKKIGINEITGDLIIDDTQFSGDNFSEGWAWESNKWSFSAPITAAMINANRVSINLTKPKYLGDTLGARFTFKEPMDMKVKSQVRAVSFVDSMNKCTISIKSTLNNDYYLNGCWPKKDTETTLKLSVSNPRKYAKEVIVQALKSYKIKFYGKTHYRTVPTNDIKKIAEIKSRKYSDFAEEILLNSNNIYTESITKTLGKKVYHSGDFKHGIIAIKKTIHNFASVDFDTIDIVDGSGLSRYNLISPDSFNKLLVSSYKNKELYSFLVKNLDWSKSKKSFIKKRFDRLGKGFSIYAKTGSLSGVIGLSGYLKTKSNKDIAYTILINGFKNGQTYNNYANKQKPARKMVDEISRLIVKNI